MRSNKIHNNREAQPVRISLANNFETRGISTRIRNTEFSLDSRNYSFADRNTPKQNIYK